MELTDLQKQACALARKQIEGKPWFRGLCLDNMPTDEEIACMGLHEAATSIAFQTAYWDADDVMNP
jgi:hypothetical protein